jgi:hypothetical protein
LYTELPYPADFRYFPHPGPSCPLFDFCCALAKSYNYSIVSIADHHIVFPLHRRKMAIVSSSILGKKSQRSLRPKERSNYDQELDFLKTFDVDKRSYRDDFPGPSDLDSWQEVSVEDSDNESDVLDYLDYLHRRRIQLIRRGGTYTVIAHTIKPVYTQLTLERFSWSQHGASSPISQGRPLPLHLYSWS